MSRRVRGMRRMPVVAVEQNAFLCSQSLALVSATRHDDVFNPR